MGRKLLIVILLSGSLAGCTGLANSWNDFQAYYNTYYNAKKYYGEGLKAVEEQPEIIEPEHIVRAHRKPTSAGEQSFQKAIEKGTHILQHHSQTKWIDDALLLIGKSYYYLQQFSIAIDYFEQIQALDTDALLMQEAIVWKGRALLDLKDYSAGIAYLNPILDSPPHSISAVEGQLQLLMGEYYALLRNWEAAVPHLALAVNHIADSRQKGRGYFLYGQVLEQLERLGEALYAYRQVSGSLAGIEYVFWAEMMQADINRKQGKSDQALTIYDRLQKNEKYEDRRDQLDYEVAHMLEMKDEYRQAESYYRKLLYGDQQTPSRNLQGKAYYQLGEMYSRYYGDYETAAAYFDTSSTLQNKAGRLMTSRQAEDMAEAYSRYGGLKRKVQRIDSLLWLASLPRSRQDSILERVQQSHSRVAANQQEEMEAPAFENQPDRREETIWEMYEQSEADGFLGYRNERLVARDKAEFISVWGDRPLSDNWRRIEVVGRTRESEDRGRGAPEVQTKKSPDAGLVQQSIKPEDIPRTPAAERKLELKRTNQLYQSANILFLDLNQPDSAKTLFYQVVESKHPQLRPKAMYALRELFANNNQADSSNYWANRLTTRFPQSKYAWLIKGEKKQAAIPGRPGSSDSLRTLRRQYRYITADPDSSAAAALRKLALKNRNAELASHIHFEAIKAFIRQAKKSSTTLVTENGDTTLSSQTLDIIFTSPRREQINQLLREHDSLFANSPHLENVQLLREELEHKVDSADIPPSCKDLNLELQIEPSMKVFLQSIERPQAAHGQHISGSIVYDFVVTDGGEVESYKLISPRTFLGFEKALEAGFEEMLRFKPLEIKDEISRLRCRLSFPVDQIGHN